MERPPRPAATPARGEARPIPIARLSLTRAALGLFVLPDAGRLRLELRAVDAPGRLLWQRELRLRPQRGGWLAAHFALPGKRLQVRWSRSRGEARVELRAVVVRPSPRPAPAVLPSPRRATLERIARNPLLAPRASHDWESQAVFNAAAVTLDERVHLLYRAVSERRHSVFGHALIDGEAVGKRSSAPVYQVPTVAEDPSTDACPYSSGATGPGCEDPRLSPLDGRVVLTYTHFDGQQPPRMAMSSIAREDFLAGRWRWEPPVFLSPLGQIHKNWVLFPERIGGRIALLHAIAPHPRIAYLDALDAERTQAIDSPYSNAGDPAAWDNQPRGAGPPPIATAAGWLLLYHAMDRGDPGRYKLGAMLLDRDRPERVLGRLPYPLLEPDARYENEGHKAGVVYCCGAVVRSGQLVVYYGGADTVLCAASVPMARLLAALRAAGTGARGGEGDPDAPPAA